MGKIRSIAVIDLKAYYAYAECVDRGLDPWTSPVVVCDKERGKNTIILSVSPYLKAHGVPSRLRFKELPKGFKYIYATPRMERYIQLSGQVVNIFLDFISEEDLHVYSIDEAFLDLTTYLNFYKKTAEELVMDIIKKVEEQTGLRATAGIGDNFFQAKVALDVYAKKSPNGIGHLHSDEIKTKLWPITPLTDIWGIGAATERNLNKLGIFTMEELANFDRNVMARNLGIMGLQLIDHANGIDESDIRETYVPEETSLTQGQTLFRDFTKEETPTLIREMCDDLATKLRNQEQTTSVVALSIGYSGDKGGFHHQMALETPTDITRILCDALLKIYDKYVTDLPIRRVSIIFGKLRPLGEHEQLNLFETPEEIEKERNLNKMLDLIKEKYGKNIILRLNALEEGSTIIERHEQIGGHRK